MPWLNNVLGSDIFGAHLWRFCVPCMLILTGGGDQFCRTLSLESRTDYSCTIWGTAQVDVSKAKYLQDVRGHFCKPLRNNCSGVVLIFQLHENRVLSFILCLYVHVCVWVSAWVCVHTCARMRLCAHVEQTYYTLGSLPLLFPLPATLIVVLCHWNLSSQISSLQKVLRSLLYLNDLSPHHFILFYLHLCIR